jgi:L-Ala-D/L-Glu epimerase
VLLTGGLQSYSFSAGDLLHRPLDGPRWSGDRMKLEAEVLHLRTRHLFTIAREPPEAVRETVWIRIRGDDGAEGWGEAAPKAVYGETAATVQALVPAIADAVEELGDDAPFRLERLEARLEQVAAGNAAVKVAVSAALHDLLGKRLGLPVWKLWGLDGLEPPRSSFTIGIDAPDLMREKVREAASYPILKVKVGTDADDRILGMIRDEAPDKTLRVDANTAWTAKQAIAALPMLEGYRVELLEQPLPAGDLEGLRLVRARSRIPLIADESCRTAADVPRLLGAVDGVNIKLAKCGSLREALRLVHVARAHGMSVMLGCMIESTLGIAAASQLAPLVDYLDLDGAALLADDPFSGPAIGEDGSLHLNQRPGLGVSRR